MTVTQAMAMSSNKTTRVTPATTGARPAGVWDALLYTQAIRLKQVATGDDEGPSEAKAGTKLARLLAVLEDRESASTLTLAVSADLESRQVWGLLKQPRKIGQVRFEAGRWSRVRSFAGRDVERAAALLREHGWRVEPPGAASVQMVSR